MGYVIITARSLFWSLTSLLSLLLMLVALMSPKWLVGQPKTITYGNTTIAYQLSVGIYTKCGRPMKSELTEAPSCTTIAVHGFATDSEVYPNTWKAGTFFIAFGLSIMAVSVFSGFISCCFQSICKKSIFNVFGAVQALAGIFYILGIMLYPMAWVSPRVIKLCGREASYYYVGDCSIGIGLYLAIGSTMLAFFCACLSLPADKSSSSRKVEDQINDGQTLICVP